MAAYDLPQPPSEAYEEWHRPKNMILDAPKRTAFTAPNASATPLTKGRPGRASPTDAQGLRRKNKWIPPLMGRKAMVTVNRYAAIATRRLLDRMDGFVPIEDGSLSVIPEYLVGRPSGKKSKGGKAKSATWSQKPLKKGPITKEDKKKMLSQSADFFFGENEGSDIVQGSGDE